MSGQQAAPGDGFADEHAAGVFRAAIEKAGLALEVDCPALDEPVSPSARS